MVGVRILECSSHYYLLRHQLYCRSMLKIVPITNDFFTQRPYHDLASAKSKLQISAYFLCWTYKSPYSNALSQLFFSYILNKPTFQNILRLRSQLIRLPWCIYLFVYRIPKTRCSSRKQKAARKISLQSCGSSFTR